MVNRPISKKRYLMALLLTMGIFTIGLLLGIVIEGKRIVYVQDLFDEQSTEFSSSQLQYSYINSLDSKESCPAIYEIFNKNLKNLDKSRRKLESYILQSTLNDESFDLLKRQYTIEQLRYWLLAGQAKELCDEDLVTILYFYSDKKECPDCRNQAFVLDYMKKNLHEKLLTFSLDTKFENEPMVQILEKQYGVSKYPTLVIDGEVMEGFLSQEKLTKNLCDRYEEKPEFCE